MSDNVFVGLAWNACKRDPVGVDDDRVVWSSCWPAPTHLLHSKTLRPLGSARCKTLPQRVRLCFFMADVLVQEPLSGI